MPSYIWHCPCGMFNQSAHNPICPVCHRPYTRGYTTEPTGRDRTDDILKINEGKSKGKGKDKSKDKKDGGSSKKKDKK